MGLFSTREDQSNSTPETIYPQIQCTPLVDVLSVSICNRLDNVDKSIGCEIYGKICVLDTRRGCEDELFSFFNKDKDNSEFVQFDVPLSLTTPSPTPIIRPSKDICLDVHLFDKKANDMVVACEKIILDKRGNECEELQYIEIDSQEGSMIFARVHYTIIQYGVAATIDVLFFSKDDKFDLFSDAAHDNANANVPHIEEPCDKADRVNYNERDCGDSVVANVFGTVSGHSDLKAANGKDWCPILLFNKSPSQGVEVKSGDFIQLSRSVVILPAYSSSLVVDVKLSHWEGDIQKLIVNGDLKFKLQNRGLFKKDIVGKHGERVRIRVNWNKSYMSELIDAMFERAKAPRRRGRGPEHWLEMSSVVLHRKDFKPCSFYGTIRVQDSGLWDCIFDKDKKQPQICRESRALVPLKDTHCRSYEILGYFLTVVDLRDTETGETISMGTVQWDDIVIPPWLDKRLCSIVRGKLGFAAVHYTTFYDGIIANLVMKLGGKHLPGYVYGKIVARYSTYEYSSAYDKKYYQITLFDNKSEGYDGSQQSALAAGSKLPLLKHDVCSATGSSLIVEADLRVSSKRHFDGDSEQGSRFLHATVELNPTLNPDNGSPARLGDETCFIDVHVSWKSEIECSDGS